MTTKSKGNRENTKGRLMMFGARFVVYFILIFLSVLCLFSFYMMLVNSSRSNFELQAGFTPWFSTHFFENLSNAWNDASINIPRDMLNSFLIAACCAILDDEGKVTDIYSAYDAGKVVNPVSIQGQIEGGVLMGMGYACTEDFPLQDGKPLAKYGRLGLLRAPQIPDIHAIYVEKDELNGVSYGSKGIGEITTIPAAPAIAGAYYAYDGVLRNKLPMEHTYYRK